MYVLRGHNSTSLLLPRSHPPRTASSTVYGHPRVIPTSPAALAFVSEWDVTLYADVQWYSHTKHMLNASTLVETRQM